MDGSWKRQKQRSKRRFLACSHCRVGSDISWIWLDRVHAGATHCRCGEPWEVPAQWRKPRDEQAQGQQQLAVALQGVMSLAEGLGDGARPIVELLRSGDLGKLLHDGKQAKKE
eukprot:5541033-Alexandrium_andersonii.AAC.1